LAHEISSSARQLRQSRQTLEKLLGHPVRWFCYPVGRNDTASAAAVAGAGYLLAYTTEGGSVLRADSLMQLPRVRVSGGQSLDSFAAAMRAASAAT
jgi:peptidoglycan/xylan/chitin deacetylase (PgdA/CDA1 family)